MQPHLVNPRHSFPGVVQLYVGLGQQIIGKRDVVDVKPHKLLQVMAGVQVLALKHTTTTQNTQQEEDQISVFEQRIDFGHSLLRTVASQG